MMTMFARWLTPLGLGLCLFFIGGCAVRQETGAHTTQSVAVQPDAVVSADPSWFACRTDTDCTVQPGVCGEPQAVNRAFLKPFDAYRIRMGQMVDCASRLGKMAQPAVQCTQQRCLIVSPTEKRR